MSAPATDALGAGESPSLRDAATNALRYWEPRRIVSTAVLTAVVITHFVSGLPSSRQSLSVDLGLLIFVQAVIANAFYCFAYIPDVFVQLSGIRKAWLRWRWVLFLIGTAFAATLTRNVAMRMFLPEVWH